MKISAPPVRKGWLYQLRIRIILGLRGVLLLEDQPSRLGLGAAAGIFASALPVFGQTLIGLVLARLIGGNPLASIPWSWLSNPLTTVPIWYAGYRIGLALLPGDSQPIAYADLAALISAIGQDGGLRTMLDLLGDLLVPLWLGCSVLGMAMAIPGYLIIRRVASAIQARRQRQRAAWLESRATAGVEGIRAI